MSEVLAVALVCVGVSIVIVVVTYAIVKSEK